MKGKTRKSITNSAETTIQQVTCDDRAVRVLWGDGHESCYHIPWLRHARHFPAFPDRAQGSERLTPPDLPGAVTIFGLSVNEDNTLTITWAPDGDQSDFDAAWLRQHCYSRIERSKRKRPVIRWDGTLVENMPRISFEQVRDSDEGRFLHYQQVLDYGFSLVQGLPPRSGEVANLAKLLGIARISAYGSLPDDKRIEDVRVDPKLTVNTRRAEFLGPHTDTVWRTANSGLVLLHCLAAEATGGESLLVDGFEVAERLRTLDGKAFAFLSRVRINHFASVVNGDEWRALGQIITCDADDQVIGFRFSDQSIPPLDLPEEMIEPAYAALTRLQSVLYDTSLWIRPRLAPGEVLVMDNQRVLHGRSMFDPESGRRHIQTCCVERDGFHSNYRFLARELGHEDWDHVLPYGTC